MMYYGMQAVHFANIDMFLQLFPDFAKYTIRNIISLNNK